MRWQRGEDDIFAVGHGCELIGLRIVKGMTAAAVTAVVGLVVGEVHAIAWQVRKGGDARDGSLCG